MNSITILIEGYAHPNSDGSYSASPSSCLINTGKLKIVVDPGANAQLLLDSLASLKLVPDDIDRVFLSHYHPDHFLNIRLFPNADVYDGTTLWRADQEHFYQQLLPDTDIELLATPGHSPEHCSPLVQTNEGAVCLAQDVFWWEDGKQQSDTESDLLELYDPFASDATALRASRLLILERATWIIPGHGRKFLNPRHRKV